MKLGYFLITIALVAAIYSAYSYWQTAILQKTGRGRKKDAQNILIKKLNWARLSFNVSTGSITLASVYFLFLIITHRFEVSYVYRYSSSDLPFGYLISVFWAGQEGSFLFWVLSLAWMGVILQRTSQNFENYAMVVVNMVQSFFLLILSIASPFELLPQIPPEGAGLNPLLQNPWMVIHPPILFIGYAAVTLPFAIGIAALLNNDLRNWVKHAIPWALFASLTLGAGIIIGGYWAYGVLGWGGYWGWDPVENSSLIAWLGVLALFHGLLLSKRNNMLQKTNLFLTIASFILVLYATFLTRSGVLADFSVHSFQDLGINTYLVLFILSSLFYGSWLIYSKRSQILSNPINLDSINRENILLGGVFLLLASAFLTIIGTSSPLITDLIGKPAQVDTSFYDKVNLPLAILMALAITMAPLMKWNTGIPEERKNVLVLASAGFLVSLIAGWQFKIENIQVLVFLAMSTAALVVNATLFVQRFKVNRERTAAPLAHLGIAVMFIGIAISGALDDEVRTSLVQGQPQQVLGYTFQYNGLKAIPGGKNEVLIDINKDGKATKARPRLYYNEMSQGTMHEPDILAGIVSDLYVSPLELQKPEKEVQQLFLKKGEEKSFAGYEISFDDFVMENHTESGRIRVGAKLNVSKDEQAYSIVPAVILNGDKRESQPADLFNNNGKGNVFLAQVNANNKEIQLVFEGLEAGAAQIQPDRLIIEISKKPFMSVLWIGTLLLSIGTIVALNRRAAEILK